MAEKGLGRIYRSSNLHLWPVTLEFEGNPSEIAFMANRSSHQKWMVNWFENILVNGRLVRAVHSSATAWHSTPGPLRLEASRVWLEPMAAQGSMKNHQGRGLPPKSSPQRPWSWGQRENRKMLICWSGQLVGLLAGSLLILASGIHLSKIKDAVTQKNANVSNR